MSRTDPAELDAQAANRHASRYVPETHPADAEAVPEFDRIAIEEETAYAAATEGIEVAAGVTRALGKARTVAKAKADAYAKVRDVAPSDREHYRKLADAMPDPDEHYRAAEAAVAVLEQEADAAATPKAPGHREYAQVADELRMLLNGATKEKVLEIAKRPRFAGLMAGSWGAAYFEATGQPEYHRAVVASATGGAGSKQATAAKRLLGASRHADFARLRAAGVTK